MGSRMYPFGAILSRRGARKHVGRGAIAQKGSIRRHNVQLLKKRHGEAVLDTLAVGMGDGKAFGGTLHVGTQLLGVALQLLVHVVLLLVVGEVVIHDLGVHLPGVGRRTLHTDLEPVVRYRPLEVAGQTSFGDQLPDGFFHLGTQRLDGFFTLVLAQHGAEHLVNDLIIVLRHNFESFVLGLVKRFVGTQAQTFALINSVDLLSTLSEAVFRLSTHFRNPVQKYCLFLIQLSTIDDKCRQLPITTNNCYLSSTSISYFSHR